MSDLEINALGVGFSHAPSFVVDRPSGSGDYLLLRFNSLVRCRDRHGTGERVAGSCICYTPAFPQWYRSAQGALNNDWVHFRAPQFEWFEPDAVFRPERDDFLAPLLRSMARERARRENGWERLSALLLEELLLRLAREHPARRLLRPDMDQSEALAALRDAIQSHPEDEWRVEEMARRVHLSPSRFAVVYRQTFGISPAEDVIQARLARARWLLLNRRVAVAQVARECGFASPFYFSRLFRRRMGCAPSDYYRVAAREGEL